MARQKNPNKGLVKCEYCGEMYSVTYKHCPFCNEDGTGRWDDLENLPPEKRAEEAAAVAPARRGGGKRVAGGGDRRGPSIGKIIAFLVSIALIISATAIVISIIRSVLGGGKDPVDPVTTPPVVTVLPDADVTPVPGESAAPDAGTDPAVTPAPVTPQAGQPTSFALNSSDFTLFNQGEVCNMVATFSPAGTKAEVVWKSSDPNVASVSWNGVVAAVGPGTATITATVEGLGAKECIVRCSFSKDSGESGQSGGQSGNSSSGLALNREDFTLGRAGETWKLAVSGTDTNPVWAISDSSVATIGGDGTVTAVAPGITTVTATVDGVSLQCTVRCTW